MPKPWEMDWSNNGGAVQDAKPAGKPWERDWSQAAPVQAAKPEAQGILGDLGDVAKRAFHGVAVDAPTAILKHAIVNPLVGVGQLVNNAVDAGAQLLPDNPVSRAIHRNTLEVNSGTKEIENQYQKHIPTNAYSVAGATAGEVVPMLFAPIAKSLLSLGLKAEQFAAAHAPQAVARVSGAVANGAAQGAAIAAVQPVREGKDYWTDKGQQVALGAALAPVLQGGIAAAGGVKQFGRELFAPAEAKTGKVIEAAAQENAAKLAEKIRAGNIELITGVKPTTAQTVQNAGLSQLERSATNNGYVPLAEQRAVANEARIAALHDMQAGAAGRDSITARNDAGAVLAEHYATQHGDLKAAEAGAWNNPALDTLSFNLPKGEIAQLLGERYPGMMAHDMPTEFRRIAAAGDNIITHKELKGLRTALGDMGYDTNLRGNDQGTAKALRDILTGVYDKAAAAGEAKFTATGQGEHGAIYGGLAGDPENAIAHLLQMKSGEVPNALTHAEVSGGKIGLVYGVAPSASAEGYGVAKLAQKHPETLQNLQDFISPMRVDMERSGKNKLVMRTPEDDKRGIVSLSHFNNTADPWLLTAYEKPNPALGGVQVAPSTRIDTAGLAHGGDTARPISYPLDVIRTTSMNGMTPKMLSQGKQTDTQSIDEQAKNMQALFGLPPAPVAMPRNPYEADMSEAFNALFKKKQPEQDGGMDNVFPELFDGLNNLPQKIKGKSNSLLTTLRDIGGINNATKNDVVGDKFAAGGYNQIFRNDAKHSFEGLVGRGELDEFLPYELRFASRDNLHGEVADMQEAVNYLKDKVRNGERVIPYDSHIELEQKALESDYKHNAIKSIQEDFKHDYINAELSIAAHAERGNYLAAKVFNPSDAESRVAGSVRGNARVRPQLQGENSSANRLEPSGTGGTLARGRSGTGGQDLTGLDTLLAGAPRNPYAYTPNVMSPAQKSVRDEANRLTQQRINRFETGPITGLLNKGSDGLPSKQGAEAFDALFNSRASQAQDIAALGKAFPDNPAVQDAMRQAALSDLLEKSTLNNGHLSSNKLDNYVKARRDALDGLFSAEQTKTLAQVQADLARATNAENFGRATGSNTMQNITGNALLDSKGLDAIAQLFSVKGINPLGFALQKSRNGLINSNKDAIGNAAVNPNAAIEALLAWEKVARPGNMPSELGKPAYRNALVNALVN